MHRYINAFLLFALPFFLYCQAFGQTAVKMWEEPLKLATYLVGAPEKSPSFMRDFAYQRAKRAVYPYPMDDNITNERVIKEYNALYLENEYVKVCILPELGGRILYAIDKTNNYDIFITSMSLSRQILECREHGFQVVLNGILFITTESPRKCLLIINW